MSKKSIILSTIAILLLIIGVASYFFLFKNKTPIKATSGKDLLVQAEKFTVDWYTYDKQSDPVYLRKLKPQMTNSFYTEVEYANTQRPQDFIDQEPSTSSIIDSKVITSSSKNAKVSLNVEQHESNKISKFTVEVSLEKINESWLIVDLEPKIN